jgi:hypothetical protein
VMELAFLHGRDALVGHEVHSLATFGPDAVVGAEVPAARGVPGAGE